uniref:NADH dehydrogenase subunit 4L n=1 Tax=Margaritifera margaritifera TaxID=102329 RepID=S4S2B3_PINMG|nr:NADH dehydrogenase subunit 4L [Pinctada margaritifera]
MGLMMFLLSMYFLCSEGSGKTLVTLMLLELVAVSSAGVYAFSSGGGNMGFLFVIFCLMGVEVSILVSVFVSVVRHKGDTRVKGVSLDGVEWG